MHVGRLQYHIVFCTKYRRDVIDEHVGVRFVELAKYKAEEKGFELLEVETMPDHVHLFVRADANTNVKYIVNQVKGYTSNVLRREFKHLRTRIPTLWTRSYYAVTVGHISYETVRKYIESQKNV